MSRATADMAVATPASTAQPTASAGPNTAAAKASSSGNTNTAISQGMLAKHSQTSQPPATAAAAQYTAVKVR